MNRSIIYSCLALGLILSLSYNLIGPNMNGVSKGFLEDSNFEKNLLKGEMVYKLSYEPLQLKKRLARSYGNQSAIDNDRYDGHHYFSLSISNLSSNTALNPVQNWEDLSEYLRDEFKNNFSLIINGERKSCVLHHAFTMPQRKNNVTIQLVFKDDGFTGQANYFQETTKVLYKYKNGELLKWNFKADELNSTPILNIKHNG